ncbi:hypothetical protein [Sphingomonas sp. R86521]|uniref:hypothetical protein n=1 Tax=Sphingomonas sp. R86521 TaxID=3093860 RepID=UPI0036D2A834
MRIWKIVYENLGMIKRLLSVVNGSLKVDSENQAVTPIEARDSEAQIVGRVVSVFQPL